MAKRKDAVLPDVVGRRMDGAGLSRRLCDRTVTFRVAKRIGTILEQDARIARGAGHHSVVKMAGADEWYIAYHRRPLDAINGHHREMAIDGLYFNGDGTIRPVRMTNEGVVPRLIGSAAN